MCKGLAPADVIAHDEYDVRLLARHLSLRGSCKVEKRRHEHDRYHAHQARPAECFLRCPTGSGKSCNADHVASSSFGRGTRCDLQASH